jgi:hypothetical protein
MNITILIDNGDDLTDYANTGTPTEVIESEVNYGI